MFYGCLSAFRPPADCGRWQVSCARYERRCHPRVGEHGEGKLASARVNLGAEAPGRGKRHSALMSELEEKRRLSTGAFHSMLLYFFLSLCETKEQRTF